MLAVGQFVRVCKTHYLQHEKVWEIRCSVAVLYVASNRILLAKNLIFLDSVSFYFCRKYSYVLVPFHYGMAYVAS
jgi:hypothetical protein